MISGFRKTIFFEEVKSKQKCFQNLGWGKLYQEFKKKMTNDDSDQYKFRIC